MITRVAFISYPVRDIERAVAFYRDTIGLTPGETFGDAVVEFEVGNVTFAVDSEAIGEPGTQSSAAFEVDDILAMHARPAKAGVTVPDGNRFGIHQRKT